MKLPVSYRRHVGRQFIVRTFPKPGEAKMRIGLIETSTFGRRFLTGFGADSAKTLLSKFAIAPSESHFPAKFWIYLIFVSRHVKVGAGENDAHYQRVCLLDRSRQGFE